MHNNKGFSLIEFLVVVALIGVLSIFFWTPRAEKWNTEVSKVQSEILGLLKYYQKKSMRDGAMYFFEFDYNVATSQLGIEPGVSPAITSRRSTCSPGATRDFNERRTLERIENIRVVGCQAGGRSCRNARMHTGLCFYPNGSSRGMDNRVEWQISHSSGDNTNGNHATTAYKLIIWPTTSFIETFVCKGEAIFTDISSTTDACAGGNWIQE